MNRSGTNSDFISRTSLLLLVAALTLATSLILSVKKSNVSSPEVVTDTAECDIARETYNKHLTKVQAMNRRQNRETMARNQAGGNESLSTLDSMPLAELEEAIRKHCK